MCLVASLREGDITPQRISQAVSVGETVILHVDTTIVDLRWRHGGMDIEGWNNNKSVVLSNITVQDGGIYECHKEGQRALGNHAITQLIVRGS